MKNIFKKVVLTAALGMALAWTGTANAETTAEQLKEITDPVALKVIADDATEEVNIRANAVHKLPIEQKVPYLTADWSPNVRVHVSYEMYMKGLLETNQFEPAIADWIATGNTSTIAIQETYIKALLSEGNTAKALSESKRLMGLTKVDQKSLLRTVNAIAGVIKGDALKNGASPKAAISAMNSYLEGVNNKDISDVAFTALPYPASDPAITALESSEDARVAAIASLYNGKYDAATAKGNDLLMAATTPAQIEIAMWVIGAAANGKAGLPTAANDALGAQ